VFIFHTQKEKKNPDTQEKKQLLMRKRKQNPGKVVKDNPSPNPNRGPLGVFMKVEDMIQRERGRG